VSFRIPDEKLQEIRERADIVQVVGERVALKKAGVRYVGLCPFHQEKTPSFSVHPGLGIFKCFGCGEAGDVISFVMKFEDRPFVEVVRGLAERYGVALPVVEGSPRDAALAREAKDERERLYHLNELATRFYHELLLKDPAAREARDYLARRGVSDESVRRFRLGFAPAAWDVTVGFFRSKKLDLDLGVTLGLVQEKERGGYYDRFRNRILFPIIGVRGEILGFGGRQLAEGDGPKYLNSPASPIFHKGRTLYGLNIASKAVRVSGTLLVVEGYLDLIALCQAGVENVVATLGTALTEDHVALLRRHAREVLVLFDGDEAGVHAAQKSAELLLRGGLSARVVELPPGDDPDTFVQREGREAFDRSVATAKPILEFVLESLAVRSSGTPAGKAGCVEALRPLLDAVTHPVERALYVAKVSDRLGVPEEAIRELLRRPPREATPLRALARNAMGPARATTPAPEIRLGALLLTHPELAAAAIREPEVFTREEILRLARRIAALYERDARIDAPSVLAEIEDRELCAELVETAFTEAQLEEAGPAQPDEAQAPPRTARTGERKLSDLLRFLRERALRAQADALQARLSAAAAQGDRALVETLATARMEIEKRIRGLGVS
jgi:DNA primase